MMGRADIAALDEEDIPVLLAVVAETMPDKAGMLGESSEPPMMAQSVRQKHAPDRRAQGMFLWVATIVNCYADDLVEESLAQNFCH